MGHTSGSGARGLGASLRRRAVPLLAAVSAVVVTACSVGGTAEDGMEGAAARPDAWTVGVAEHIALWYHALAYLEQERPADDRGLPPRFRPDYVSEIVAVKRDRGVYPTPLDERAAEFGDVMAGVDAYDPLQFLPLYFRDAEALFSSVDLWVEAGGDPRRAGSQQAAQVIAFLSELFPGTDQRRTVAAWTDVVRAEREAFYEAYWTEREPTLAPAVAAVQREWDALEPDVRNFLDYMQLDAGDILLVPAIGAEGRIVVAGPTVPRAALLVPPETRPRDAVWSFVHELMYPLVDDVIDEYVAPVRIREIGPEVLGTRAAVRGGAMLIERARPDRVEEYRRFFLESLDDDDVPADDGRTDSATRFERAFPLPSQLERGLREAVGQALAGI